MSQSVSSPESAAWELPADRLVGDYSLPQCRPLDDPVAAVAAALVTPLDFPPLSVCTVAGDQIALAVDRGVPQAAAVVAGVMQTLIEAGVSPANVAVVCAAETSEAEYEQLLNLVPDEVRVQLRVETHDPHDRQTLQYLAASRSNKPIYFNRTLCDADVVIPIGTMRLESSLGYVGVHGGLFPAFSDDETRRRFAAPSSADHRALHRRRHEEVDEAAWLLGVQFTVQVIPGPGDSILQVLCGDANRVAEEGQRRCQTVWLHSPPSRAGLVVATIEGGDHQQTWENIGRALFAALQAVDEQGAVVLCTNVRQPPGPAVRRLSAPRTSEEILHALRRDHSADAITAALLLESRQRCRVYLMSGLDEETVEDLGLAHVRDQAQVGRLGQQYASCIFLRSAQHAMVRAAEN
ncbi:MAG: DUF2088 domain-containing protein [Planctomycetales bacterium]|nr:DUF2088 domain-containing protein [Planctomycetales bacterium]